MSDQEITTMIDDDTELPTLPRQTIILGLLRLRTADLLSLMKVWVVGYLQSNNSNRKKGSRGSDKEGSRNKKGKGTIQEDMEYHFNKLKKEVAKLPKRGCIIKWLEEYLDQKLTPIQEAQLELSYIVRRPNKLVWKVYQLDRVEPLKITDFETQPNRVQALLSKSLAPYFSQLVYVARYNKDLWIRLAIYPSRSTLRYPKVYIMFRPSTNFLLIGPIRPDIRPYVLQALSEVFQLNSISTLPLSGKNPLSLLNLTLHQHSQGPYSQYRLGQVDLPLLHSGNKSLLLPSHRKPSALLPKSLVDEERLEKGYRRNLANREFGPNPQPTLDKIDVQLDIPLSLTSLTSNPSSTPLPFTFSLQLEGTHLLHGLHTLHQLQPLPSYLTQLPSQACNQLKIDRLDTDPISPSSSGQS